MVHWWTCKTAEQQKNTLKGVTTLSKQSLVTCLLLLSYTALSLTQFQTCETQNTALHNSKKVFGFCTIRDNFRFMMSTYCLQRHL